MPFEFHIPFELHPPPGVSPTQWLIVLVAGFVLLAFIVVRFIFPMIGVQLTARQAAIAETAQQVEATLKETEELRSDYQMRLERIEDETEARLQEAIREADLLREHILSEAKQNAEGILRRGQEEVERERAKALANLRNEFIEDVIQATEFAVARSMSDTTQKRLVQEFVKNVGTKS